MIKKLKALIKKYGILQVTSELGYRSTSTIRHWIKNNEIPAMAKESVNEYLKLDRK